VDVEVDVVVDVDVDLDGDVDVDVDSTVFFCAPAHPANNSITPAVTRTA
jgi:hypothetical protein